MTAYRYRLTVTFQSDRRQWVIGVQTAAVGTALAYELTRHSADVAHVCFSTEETGKVHWLRKGAEFQS